MEPIWIYDEDGSVMQIGLPKELSNNDALNNLMQKIMITYSSLFINNEKNFLISVLNQKTKKKNLNRTS